MENIIINFSADSSGLQPGIDGLVQLEVVDREVAEQAKKTAAEMDKRNKAIADGTSKSTSEVEKLSNSFKNLDKSIIGGAYEKALQQLHKTVQGTADEFKALSLVIDFAKQRLEQLDPATEQWKILNAHIQTGETLLRDFGVEAQAASGKMDDVGLSTEQVKNAIAEFSRQGVEGTKRITLMIAELEKKQLNLRTASQRSLDPNLLKQYQEGLKKTDQQLALLFTVLDDLQDQGHIWDEFATETEQATQKSVTMRTQLRQLKEELTQLEAAGQVGSEAFINLSIEAAKLENQISDTDQRIRAMASDTFVFDAMIQGVTGVASAFSVVQGVTALVGDENEDLQKALLKVNAAMAILQGLSQIQIILKKQSAISIAVENAQKRISVLQTNLQSSAESKNIVVKYASVAAQKALNAVMAASPAGILLLAIGALAAAMTLFSSKTDDAKRSIDDLNKSIEDQKELLDQSLQLIDDNGELQLQAIEKNLRKQGKKEEEITQALEEEKAKIIQKKIDEVSRLREEEAEKQKQVALVADLDLSTLEKAQTALQKAENQLRLKDDEEWAVKTKAIATSVIEHFKKENALVTQLLILQNKTELDTLKEAAEKAKEEEEKRKEIAERNAKARFEILKREKEREIALFNSIAELEGPDFVSRRKALEQALLAEEELIILQRNHELSNAKLTAKERELIEIKANDAIIQKRTEYGAALIKLQQNISALEKQAITDAENLIVGEIQKKIDDLNEIFSSNIKFSNIEETGELRRLLDSYDKGLISTEEYEKKKTDIQNRHRVQNLNYEKASLEKQLELHDLSTDQKKEVEKRLAQVKKEIFDADVQRIEERIAEEVRLEQERIQLFLQLNQAAFSILQNIVDNHYNAIASRRQQDLDQEIEKINRQREFELSAKGLTEEQKAQINRKYDQQERELKRQAAEDDKRLKKQQAIINGFLAVTNALASVQPLVPAGLIAAGLAAAMAALQVDAIENTSIPQFYKGTKKAPAGYKWVGEKGPELIYDKGGYPIIPHDKSMQLAASKFSDLKIMDQYNLPKPTIYQNATLPKVPEYVQNITNQSTPIDYEKLGDVIAQKLAENPHYTLSFNEEGFKLSMKKGIDETSYINHAFCMDLYFVGCSYNWSNCDNSIFGQ